MQKISAFLLICFAYAVHSQIVVAPSSVNFGDVPLGPSIAMDVYVINVGNESVTMSGVGGGVNEPFDVSQTCQNNVILPGQKCLMIFYFKPSTLGPATAISQGTWNDYPYNISLTANVVEPEISIAPAELDFGTVAVGSFVTKIVYITNVGDSPMVMSGIGGGLNMPFYDSQSCQENILPPGSSCQMSVTFAPTTSGNASAVLSGSWNGVSYNIPLTGNTDQIQA